MALPPLPFDFTAYSTDLFTRRAGFFPGAIYLIGQWYPPSRTQFRISLFYCASAASGAFSGLLAAAIAKMDGIGTYGKVGGSNTIFLLL